MFRRSQKLPDVITVEMVFSWFSDRADIVHTFNKLFPEGMDFTRENLLAVSAAIPGLVASVANAFVPDSVKPQLEKWHEMDGALASAAFSESQEILSQSIKPLSDEYEAAIAPHRKIRNEKLDAARIVYEAAKAEADAEFEAATKEPEEVWKNALAEVHATHSQASDEIDHKWRVMRANHVADALRLL